MQIVFCHYHLNAGGVTQVIVNQMRALAQLQKPQRPDRVGVLYGGRHEGWPEKVWDKVESGTLGPFDEVLMALPSIDYDPLPEVHEDRLATEVLATLSDHGFAPDDTILHLHNHSLGKNVSWPGAVRILAQHGYRLLLQIHDFAEDFRPTNFRHLAIAWRTDDPLQVARRQYPTGPGIHYATLTRRDYDLLEQAGMPAKRLHTLPNPVGEFTKLKPAGDKSVSVRSELGLPEDARLVLYPVRGIRRKNLGELLLHAAISPPDTWHALTLAPENPAEIPSFNRWRELSAGLELRCLFDICGSGTSKFFDALFAADSLITTSVAEGFGMVFLEAWLAGKPLVGRDLPGITSDFKSAGIEFDGLYESLQIPLDLIDQQDELPAVLRIAYEWACENYGIEPADASETSPAIEALLAEDQIDFALLPSRFQEQVIRVAAREPEAVAQQLLAANPLLASIRDGSACSEASIEPNAKIVRKNFSLKTIGRRLGEVYQEVLSDPPATDVQPAPSGGDILRQFLRIDRVHAIRFEE